VAHKPGNVSLDTGHFNGLQITSFWAEVLSEAKQAWERKKLRQPVYAGEFNRMGRGEGRGGGN